MMKFGDVYVQDYFEVLRQPHLVPVRLQKYLCLHEEISIRPPDPPFKFWVTKCCKKLPIHHFNQCFECEQFFIRDFHHPDYCPTEPMCWTCVLKCGRVCEHTRPVVARNMYMEPFLPPIIEYSRTELIDAGIPVFSL